MSGEIGHHLLHMHIEIALRRGVCSGENLSDFVFIAIIIRQQLAIFVLGERSQSPVGFHYLPEVGLHKDVVECHCHLIALGKAYTEIVAGNQS